MTPPANLARLRHFVQQLAALLQTNPAEPQILLQGKALLAELVAHDDWLPAAYAQPDPARYQQCLLHADALGRFSVVSFVWGPGQSTPIHDHTVWGLIGMLRGREQSQPYAQDANGRWVPQGQPHTLLPGQVEAVSPSIGDVHRVSNALADQASISIHVYGANIGAVRRSVYLEDGTRKPFVSGYSNATLPNLWDLSAHLQPQDVRAALLAGEEIALLDVREEDPFAQAHPLFAANLPLARIELDAYSRIPRRTTRIVVYDNGEGLAPRAANRLRRMGYSAVSELDGGLAGWRAAGLEIFKDVNVPSKSFGELVESKRHTPSLSAEEVKALLDAQADVVVLDARRFDEYQTMSLPGAVSVPGAELVLRARAQAPNPATRIIVNCAGRTRSIIGTQSLVNAGIPNPVCALRNGTIGWTLAGQTLAKGASGRFNIPTPEQQAQAAHDARAVADRAGVRRASAQDLLRFAAETGRTTYRFDVRTPEEYAQAHLPGFQSAPGGQLVQETDVSAPVRGARIVLADDDGVRANMSASWLAQMGWEVWVLDPSTPAERSETGTPKPEVAPPEQPIHWTTATQLAQWLAEPQGGTGTTAVIDLTTSAKYVHRHIPGAWYAQRAQLAQALARIGPAERYVLTCGSGRLASYAAAELAGLTVREVTVLQGGTQAWIDAGLALESGETRLASPRTDRYRRPYEGTDNPREAMQGYLDWEFGLVEQLARDGTHGFKVI